MRFWRSSRRADFPVDGFTNSSIRMSTAAWLIHMLFLLISLVRGDIFNQHFLHNWLVFSWESRVKPRPKEDSRIAIGISSYAKSTISIAINVPKACLIMNELTSARSEWERATDSLLTNLNDIYNKLCRAIYLIASRASLFYGQFIKPKEFPVKNWKAI